MRFHVALELHEDLEHVRRELPVQVGQPLHGLLLERLLDVGLVGGLFEVLRQVATLLAGAQCLVDLEHHIEDVTQEDLGGHGGVGRGAGCVRRRGADGC
jgi:hypothetical protein